MDQTVLECMWTITNNLMTSLIDKLILELSRTVHGNHWMTANQFLKNILVKNSRLSTLCCRQVYNL